MVNTTHLTLTEGAAYAFLKFTGKFCTRPNGHFIEVTCNGGYCDGTPYWLSIYRWGISSYCKRCCTYFNIVKRRAPDALTEPARAVDAKEMLKTQQGLCAWPMCKQPITDSQRKHVDHNHRMEPGKRCTYRSVRGVVHSGCNAAIGYADKFLESGMWVPSEEILKYLTNNGEDKLSAS